jgi:hypothetical protein
MYTEANDAMEQDVRGFVSTLVSAAPWLANGTTVTWNVVTPVLRGELMHGLLRVAITWDASRRDVTYNNRMLMTYVGAFADGE